MSDRKLPWISDEAIADVQRAADRDEERERLRLSSFNPLDYITTEEALEAYVQERIRLHLDLIKGRL